MTYSIMAKNSKKMEKNLGHNLIVTRTISLMQWCVCIFSYMVQHNKLISLSEQCLVDCSWGFGNNGCDGGESERAYKWIMKYGCLPTESTYGQYLMEVRKAL